VKVAKLLPLRDNLALEAFNLFKILPLKVYPTVKLDHLKKSPFSKNLVDGEFGSA